MNELKPLDIEIQVYSMVKLDESTSVLLSSGEAPEKTEPDFYDIVVKVDGEPMTSYECENLDEQAMAKKVALYEIVFPEATVTYD